MQSPTRFNRREAFSLIAVSAAGGVLMSQSAFAQEAGAADTTSLISGADVCVITPETTAGPFYFDPGLERADITEGRPGVATRVRLQVVDAACQAVAGARIDIWHCDASGLYSGYPGHPGGLSTVGETFMRGTQFADANGVVEFATVYPGWYPGRTAHIHFIVFLAEATILTGQIFFPDDVSTSIYQSQAPYNERGAERDTLNADDGIARRAGSASLAAVETASGGYLATMIIGMNAAG